MNPNERLDMSDVPKPSSSIRREAEALVKKWFDSTLAANDQTYVGHTEEEWKSLEAAIEAFAKAQRREVWEEAAKLIEDEWEQPGECWLAEKCRQRKKEWE